MTSTRRNLIIVIAGLVAAVLIVGGTLVAADVVGLAIRTATGHPSATPSQLGEVESIAQLRRELTSRGLPECGGYEAIDSPTGSRERGRCWVGTAEIVIGVYVDHASAAAQWDRKATLLEGVTDLCMATGTNWTVDGDDCGYVRRAAEVTGARYQQQP